MHAQSIQSATPIAPPAGIKDAGPELDRLRLVGLTRGFARGREIFGEGERAGHVYSVISGAVRSFRVLSDGRRQVLDFYLPGDIFGIEPGPDHGAGAEAVSDVILLVARRSLVADEGDGAVTRRLLRLAVDDLRRSREHVLTLGCRTACERVASFLNDLAVRLGNRRSLDLPMSRQDIADYLGLTIETVSRTFTLFQTAGLIRLHGRRSVELCRPNALINLCA